jgi:ABC-type dipeptide/oligopeptide/nickel transport system permease subunit
VTLTVKQEPYVEAAVSLGGRQLRVMALHILPNIVPPLLVIATVLLGSAIVVESALGFLGLGTQPPAPSWGNMIGGSARFELQSAPWLVWAPALAISLTVLSFNLLGDALRDVLDPRLRGSR